MNSQATQFELLQEFAEHSTSYLEVGVQEGRSLEVVVKAARNLSRIVLCDEWGSVSGGSGRGSCEHIIELLKTLGYHGTVAYLNGDSRTLLPLESGWFDLVHIDGGHSFEVANSDISHGWRMCKGVMLVHDTAFTDVWRALSMFLSMTQDQPLRVEYYFGGHGTAVLYR